MLVCVCVWKLFERLWCSWRRKKCADGKKLKSKCWRNGEEESKWEGVKVLMKVRNGLRKMRRPRENENVEDT
jgi:hypothetical protein